MYIASLTFEVTRNQDFVRKLILAAGEVSSRRDKYFLDVLLGQNMSQTMKVFRCREDLQGVV